MRSTTIRVSEKTHHILHALAADSGVTMADIVEQALELYRRQRMFEQADAAYAALRADPKASAEWDAEIGAWDATLADGLGEY
jgi:hypothetical protein